MDGQIVLQWTAKQFYIVNHKGRGVKLLETLAKNLVSYHSHVLVVPPDPLV